MQVFDAGMWLSSLEWMVNLRITSLSASRVVSSVKMISKGPTTSGVSIESGQY